MKILDKLLKRHFRRSNCLIICSGLFVSTIYLCSLSTAQQLKGDSKLNFHQAIRNLPSHTVSKTPGKDFGHNVFRVSEDVLHAKDTEHPLVLRVTENEEGLWLQMVRVHVFGTRDGFALIRGVNIDDKLIHMPSESLIHLQDLDAKELQKGTLPMDSAIEYR